MLHTYRGLHSCERTSVFFFRQADTSENFDEYYAQSTTEREQGRFFMDFTADFGEEYSNANRPAADGSPRDKRFTGAAADV